MSSKQIKKSPPGALPGLIGWTYRNRWFVGCVALLAVFTVGFEVRFRGNVIRKEALPLKRELSQLDRGKLVYQDPATGATMKYVLAGNPIQLPPEMVDQLGTDQYLSWPLQLVRWDEDPSKRQPVDEPFHLFITYYTGKPDQVPHVPEQCMLGNGFQPVGDQLVNVELPGLPEKDRAVPVQALRFHRTIQMFEESRLVMYTFRACDQWHADRDRLRLTLGNPQTRYAYFSKVEISFQLPPEMPPEAVAGATEAGRRFLQAALPVLVRDHWPVWPSEEEPARSAETGK